MSADQGQENVRDIEPEARERRARVNHLKTEFSKAAGEDRRISKHEFNAVLRHPQNNYFTDRLFDLFDADNNGYINEEEFIEFLDGLKSVDDKIDLLFDLYNENGDGHLSHSEVFRMIEAMVDAGGIRASHAEIDKMATFFYQEGIGDSVGEGITKEQFRTMIKEQEDFGQDVSTLIDHWIGAVKDRSRARKSSGEIAKAIDLDSKMKTNPNFYAFLVAFVLIVVAMMGIAGYMHSGARDKDGEVNYFLICARIFGFPLNFLGAMIFVYMCKPIQNGLRELGLIRYLPLDDSLWFHMITGYLILIYGTIHTIVHFLNFGINVSPDPVNYLARNGKTPDMTSFRPKEEGGAYTYAEWMFTVRPGLFGLLPGWANPTGVLLEFIMIIIFFSSLECVRRGGYFNLFYYFHLLYWPFMVLLVLHAPNYSYFFLIPGIFMVLHVIRKIFYGHLASYVTTGILLPPDSFALLIRKPVHWAYATGDWVSLNVPSIAEHEWHAFTISSAPELPDVFTLHIRAVGPWTKELRKRIYKDYEKYITLKDEQRENRHGDMLHIPHKLSHLIRIVHYKEPKGKFEQVFKVRDEAEYKLDHPIKVHIDGPFHAPASNIFRTQHAVLVATGIGVTPMASVLQTIFLRYKKATQVCNQCSTAFVDEDQCSLGNLRKVEFYWIVGDPTEVSWFLDLLTGIEIEQAKVLSNFPKFLDLHVYITRAVAKTDMCAVGLRIAMNLFHKRTNRDFFTGLRTQTKAGRPNLNQMFQEIYDRRKGEVGVYFCGNPIVGNIIQQKCYKYHFRYHREVF